MYERGMIASLRKQKYSWQIGSLYIGCTMHTDDLLLLPGSVLEPQKSFTVAGKLVRILTVRSLIVRLSVLSRLHSQGQSMERYFVDSKKKYLGVNINNWVKFTIKLVETRRIFFASVHTILSRCKYSIEIVKLELKESHGLHILLFGLESLNLKAAQIKIIGW